MNHIYWFAYYDLREPSVRYGAFYLLPQLRKAHGITGDLVLPGYSARRILHFVRVFFSALLFPKHRAILVFQKIRTRRIYGTMLWWLAKWSRLPIVYDVDDADYLHYPEPVIQYFLRAATGVVAGSAALAGYAGRHCRKVRMITSPVTLHGYQSNLRRGHPLRVGWIGYYEAHRESLHQLLFPALARLAVPIRLLLLGVKRPEDFEELNAFCTKYPHIRLDMPNGVDWNNEDDLYRRMALCDLAVSPMLDTEWNRAKSAYKAKQFLSCGVPVLASPVGENARFVLHGKNGFLCASSDDFAAMLSKAADLSDDEYRALCMAALESAAGFQLAHAAMAWEQFGSLVATTSNR